MALTYIPVIRNGVPADFTDVDVSGTLTVDGATSLSDTTMASAAVTGNETVGGTLAVTGNTTLNGVTVSGTASMGTVLAGPVSATQVSVSNPSGATDGVTVKTDADTNPRLSLDSDGTLAFGPGNAASDTTLTRTGVGALSTPGFFAMGSGQSSGTFNTFATGNNALRIGSAGGGLSVRSGANATIGTATLVTGSVTVNTTRVTATSLIFVTVQAIGTVTSPKAMTILNKTAGVSFQIVSADATDTSTVAWWIVETV